MSKDNTGLQVNSGQVLSLTEFSPNLYTFGFQSFWNFRIVDQTLWTIVALCNCFFLMLLLDVVQSTFKKSCSSGSEWLSISLVLSFLQEICVSFMLHSRRENQRKIHLWSSLWASVWMLTESVSQWSQHSSQPPSLLVPLLAPAWRIRWRCSLLWTTLVWPSTNGFFSWDERICSSSEHLKLFWMLNRLQRVIHFKTSETSVLKHTER